MSDTVFTKIMRGEIECAKIYEDERIFAFMDAGQVQPGHVLVALKRPAETILEMTTQETAHMFAVVQRIARAIDAEFTPAGLTILQANRPAGWQTIPHVHVHVLPRAIDDEVKISWPRRNPSLAELRELASRIIVD